MVKENKRDDIWWLRPRMGLPHTMLACLGSASGSGILQMDIFGWFKELAGVSASHMKELDGVPDLSPQPGPVLAVTGVWGGMTQQTGVLSMIVCSFFPLRVCVCDGEKTGGESCHSSKNNLDAHVFNNDKILVTICLLRMQIRYMKIS